MWTTSVWCHSFQPTSSWWGARGQKKGLSYSCKQTTMGNYQSETTPEDQSFFMKQMGRPLPLIANFTESSSLIRLTTGLSFSRFLNNEITSAENYMLILNPCICNLLHKLQTNDYCTGMTWRSMAKPERSRAKKIYILRPSGSTREAAKGDIPYLLTNYGTMVQTWPSQNL